jgi:hypothetical protein
MAAVTPAQMIEVRQRYSDKETVASIMARLGLGRHEVYRCVNGGPDSEGNTYPPLPLRMTRRLPGGAARKALVSRIWRVAETQVSDIERRLQIEEPGDERERTGRMLATMIKTLRELRAFDAKAEEKPAHHDDREYENLDDFRRKLARKIDAIVAERASPGAGGREG